MEKNLCYLGLICLFTACHSEDTTRKTAADSASPSSTRSHFDLAAFQKRAGNFHSVISLPQFETSVTEVSNAVQKAIAQANSALDEVGQLDPAQVNFKNTVLALDDVGYAAGLTANRVTIIKETSTDEKMRDAAVEASKVFEEWAVGLDYREDVYKSVKAFAAKNPKLTGEDARLLEFTLRDYRRAGLSLPRAERDEVEKLRKELARLSTDFEQNVTQAKKALKLTGAELEGVPESFLNQPSVKTGADEYTVLVNVTLQYLMVMENAKKEETRKKVETEHDRLAREKNIPLLEQILALRTRIAKKLGYASWADYQIEVKMAKDARTASDFLEKLKTGLQPKFDAEVAELQKLKARETGNAGARINLWDWRYYANQLKKERYTVDEEALRVYFPYEKALQGMFAIYQKIFGLKFAEVDAPYKWIGDLKLFAVSDAASGEPLGLFYLDMFPREGKYNHFAQFGIIEGKLLPNGQYQRPTVALICNFPPPQKDQPSLMSHSEVETLFHEFGHAMHSILTRAKYSRFAGTSVPRDFVEAPSQMLENWVWDKKVLDSFAADYRDPTKKIPASILGKLKEAKLAVEGNRYRRQLSFGLLDLALHSAKDEAESKKALEISNRILSEVLYPVPDDTAFVAYFGHLMGYDAGYYGYAWADAIAADMATVFEKSPGGYFDTGAGMRLRREVYEPGDSRDVNISIEKFLGRPRSINPFLKKIGIETK
jgi:thimet oligopeptidase